MDTDVIIAGGGLNGATLALALAQGGLSSVVVDPVPQSTRSAAGFDGRSYALSVASRNLLTALRLWGDIADRCQPILGIRVSDGQVGTGASPLSLAFDHAEIEEGPMGHMVEDRVMRPALLAAMDGTEAISAISGVSVTAQKPAPGGVTATLSDGQQVTGAVLIGCDGRGSGTAARAAIRRIGWDYAQSSLVAAIEHERHHDGIAHQLFLPAGPLAILPLPGNRSSIVWTETRDAATRISALDDAAWLDILRPRFGDFLGEIALRGARYTYPLRLQIAQSFIADRTALCGDAAHVVHPLAGQGLNSGLKDVAALAEVLADAHRRGEDIGQPDVLTRYQNWRRFDVAALAMATDGFNRLFSNDSTVLRVARDLGLAAVNAVAPLRRGAIREAAGLTGNRPRLLRGLGL